MKTALIAGASGLIGGFLLPILLKDSRYSRVISVGRRKLGIEHPKLTEVIVDMDDLPAMEKEKIDDVFCCLGTTIKKAGSKENFRRVDFQYPLNLAEFGLAYDARRYTLVSSMGADEESKIFYSRTKGEVEKVVATIGYNRVDIMRPSALLGPRKEFRLGERLGIILLRLFGFLLIGKAKKYRAIEAETVAKAMDKLMLEEKPGVFIHESDEIKEIVS